MLRLRDISFVFLFPFNVVASPIPSFFAISGISFNLIHSFFFFNSCRHLIISSGVHPANLLNLWQSVAAKQKIEHSIISASHAVFNCIYTQQHQRKICPPCTLSAIQFHRALCYETTSMLFATHSNPIEWLSFSMFVNLLKCASNK